MSNYLETIYFRDEYAENKYPQKLCDHIIKNYIQPHIGTGELSDISLLDIGSGKGNHLVGFSRRGIKVSGLDKRKECLAALEQFEILECDIESEPFPYKSDTFDVLYSKSVLEHVSNADNFLSEAFRVLKKGGLAIFMCPDWGTQRQIYWDDYTHVKAWTRKGLQNAMKMHGFSSVKASLFRQLPVLWKYPLLNIFSDFTALVCPHSLKWKDKEESQFRPWIRFSIEQMILSTGVK